MWPGPAPLARRARVGTASPTLTSNLLCVFVNSWLVQSCVLPCKWGKVWALGKSGCSGAQTSHGACQAGDEAEEKRHSKLWLTQPMLSSQIMVCSHLGPNIRANKGHVSRPFLGVMERNVDAITSITACHQAVQTCQALPTASMQAWPCLAERPAHPTPSWTPSAPACRASCPTSMPTRWTSSRRKPLRKQGRCDCRWIMQCGRLCAVHLARPVLPARSSMCALQASQSRDQMQALGSDLADSQGVHEAGSKVWCDAGRWAPDSAARTTLLPARPRPRVPVTAVCEVRSEPRCSDTQRSRPLGARRSQPGPSVSPELGTNV